MLTTGTKFSGRARAANFWPSVLAGLGAISPALGCSESLPLPARAAMVAARECQGLPPSDEAASTIQAATVVRVGSTCHTDYCSGVGQVYGVTLVVRAPQGVTAEPFAKILACHSAMVLAGTAPPLANDPYSLPDSWVGIGVKEEAGYFDVTLTGDSVSDNLRILQRAKALARSSTGEPPSPAR